MSNENKGTLVQPVAKVKSKEALVADVNAQKTPVQINRSTAISILDRSLGGGLPSGAVVYLFADSKSMAEVFLYQFTQARKTYYFCNERNPKYIIRDIKNYDFKTDNIVFVDIYSEYYITAHGEMVDNIGNEFVDAKIIEFTEANLKKIITDTGTESDINIIFDSFSFYLNLNVNPGAIKRLMNVIYEATKDLNCLSFLYGLKDTHEKNLENEILKSCDVIFEVDLEKTTEKISSRLAIPKIRGKAPATEMLKFRVGEGIQIDTTKDIA